ncbi:MAG TPA: nucleosidase [Candidatus Nanopelagicales bacterium]|nr:nucleosidase [Candidatus Nanopelagicales bacterium]
MAARDQGSDGVPAPDGMGGMELRGTVTPDLPLLVVALREEAAGLDDRLPVLVTGAGKVRAAVSTAALLATARPSCVINIGTAGGLRDGLLGVHEIGTVMQHDFNDEGVFETLGVHFGAPIALGEGLTLATGDRFVAGGPLREDLARRADLVDMEGYAVALAAHEAGVPVRLVKLVSDDADASALRTWAETVADHAHTLADWVLAHL